MIGGGMSEQCSTVLRFATLNDRRALWTWRRDAVHFDFYQGIPVSLTAHNAWYQAVLQDDSRLLLVGWRDSLRVGAVILRRKYGGQWETNVLVKPAYLGQGVGSALLLRTPAFLAGIVNSPRGGGVNLNGLADHMPAAEVNVQFQGGKS